MAQSARHIATARSWAAGTMVEASAVGAAPSSPSRPPQKLLEGATTWRPGHSQNVEISARLSRCQSRFVSILPFCILQEHPENSWGVFRIDECNICYFHYYTHYGDDRTCLTGPYQNSATF